MKRINNTAKEFKCQRNNKFTKKENSCLAYKRCFLPNKKVSKTALQRCSHKKVKKFSELQENNHAEVWFQ